MVRNVLVVGAGVFGVTTAFELRRRGALVTLLDPGPVPHPHAASNDAAKVVRIDYGDDELMTALAEIARRGWLAWNDAWKQPVYHETGCLFLTRQPLVKGTFEFESLRLLRSRGHQVERLSPGVLAERHPALAADAFHDAYYNPLGGSADATTAVARMAAESRAAGVDVLEGSAVAAFLVRPGRAVTDLLSGVGPHEPPGEVRAVPAGEELPPGIVCGVVTEDGRAHQADTVVVAAGAWTPNLLPHLQPALSVVSQPVVHLRPETPEIFSAPALPVWAADVTTTGFYGTSLLPDGTVKVARHGAGSPADPDGPRDATAADERACRAFLADALPGLSAAPLDRARRCLYCDTTDGHFWIDHDPDRPGLMVAAGGSGHAFKFAPVLGPLVADVLEGKAPDWAQRFAWRLPRAGTGDASRRRR